MNKIYFLITCFLFLTCKTSPDIKGISVLKLKEELDLNPSIQLLDVRTPSEYENGVIADPIKINIFDSDFEIMADSLLNKSKNVYIYCRSGGRSLRAANILLEKGYTPINIQGGYKSWSAKVKKIK